MKTGTDAVGLDHNPIIADTTAKVTMTPTEAIPGHITKTTDGITGVVHGTHTQVLIHIVLTATFHTTDHLHIGALQPTPETAADHIFVQPTNQLRKAHTNLHHNPKDHKVKHILKGIQELQKMTVKWTFTVQMTIPVIQKRTQTISTSLALSQ